MNKRNLRRIIKPRKKQKAFKNEELSINKIKKNYEKFILQPNFSKRLSQTLQEQSAP
ncbi:hypothetical protein H9Q08_16980 [Chryseobacterium sp. PS-8]|uniref:Uncharacterized protein n=1 Tax=Chryseobacterium indicum TaxID=2766954 RepID=A0ABS9CC98_9FLAO|nr:hypothetical protein [Chryseobacterium sp. PS-8]MCF2220981.1 hypothetical protein [Chryseobacterium sp. PS-8]